MEKTPKPPLEELVADIAIGLAETRRLLEENARADEKRTAKTAADIAEIRRADKKRADEFDLRMKKLDETQEKTSQGIDGLREAQERTNQNLGGLGEAEGRELEDDVIDALAEAEDLCGIPLEDVRPNMQSRKHDCQFDAVAINGKKVIVVEVKRKLLVRDVYKFIESRLPRFAEAFPNDARGKEVIGAMVYRLVNSNRKAIEVALDKGLLVLRAGDNKKLYQVKN